MKNSIKSKSKIVILILIIGFILLFSLRLTINNKVTNMQSQSFHQPEIFNEILDVRKNYASKKHLMAAGQAPIKMDQKYEKIAEIMGSTPSFNTSEQLIRQQIKNYNGLIQFENKSGNDGFRQLHLVIGVPPENFDSIYGQLIKIGNIHGKQITKKDKTNEYKELNAKKFSLEKIRQSLIKLKSEGGRIDEYMQLENRILEVEQQLQELGVSLGNFDAENEFCTVKFSLSETFVVQTSFLDRVLEALEWTLTTYIKLLFIMALISGVSYVTALTTEKIRPKNK